jgi:hypothetical protein
VSEGRELTRLVILDGQVWPAGSTPPAEVAARIKNPLCWRPVEDDPPLPWGPEGMPSISTASSPVIPAEPARGIPNLDEKAGDSAVVGASTGSVIGRAETDHPLTEPEQPEPAAEPKLLDRIAVDDDEAPPLLQEPPRSGKGASEAAWRQYAQSYGVQVPEGADRADIIAACKDAGLIK